MTLSRALMVGLLAALSACTSFSSYDTARLLAPGHLSVTGAGAYAEHHQSGAGFDGSVVAGEAVVRRGFSPRVEGGARLSVVHGSGGLRGDLVLGYLDVKLALLDDELALVLPVGMGYRQSDLHDLQLQPTLLYTATLSPSLELDAAPKLIVISDNDRFNRLGQINAAFDLGVRIRSDWSRWALHPEVGVMMEDLTDRLRGLARSFVIGGGLALIYAP